MGRSGRSTAAFLLAACGCSNGTPPPADGGPSCEVEVTWGRVVKEAFVAFQNGDRAEITLGFQGFRFIISAGRLRRTQASRAAFNFDVSVEGQSPVVQWTGTVDLRPGEPDARYADDLLVFFNDVPLAELIGRRAEIITMARAGPCAGRHAVTVILDDADPCVQLADGGSQCPDGGF